MTTSTAYEPGDRIFRWVWTGGDRHGLETVGMQPLTVIRVNRATVTVKTDQGSTFRLPHSEVGGRWEE